MSITLFAMRSDRPGKRLTKCNKCRLSYHKTYNDKNRTPEKDRLITLQVYGIDHQVYNSMFDKQNGVCAICKNPEMEIYKHLAVDHCHKTNTIRALLCGNCNRGLGIWRDSVQNLFKAISYLSCNIRYQNSLFNPYSKSQMSGRECGLWDRHRMTLLEFEKLSLQQEHKCRICDTVQDLHVDHDHSDSKGTIRGLLCGPCNRALGMFKDNIAFLEEAINYLDRVYV